MERQNHYPLLIINNPDSLTNLSLKKSHKLRFVCAKEKITQGLVES